MVRSPADYVLHAATQALAGVGTYMHVRYADATLIANYAQVPVIVLEDYTLNQKATTDRVVRANLSLFFGTSKPGQGDDPGAEHDCLIQMGQLRQRFLAALDANPAAELANILATPMHNVFEAELTGLGMQLTLGVPASPLLDLCLPESLPDSVVPGYSDKALLLALIANGVAVVGHETSHSYSSDYR